MLTPTTVRPISAKDPTASIELTEHLSFKNILCIKSPIDFTFQVIDTIFCGGVPHSLSFLNKYLCSLICNRWGLACSFYMQKAKFHKPPLPAAAPPPMPFKEIPEF